MKRRTFINRSLLFAGGSILSAGIPFSCTFSRADEEMSTGELYSLFKNPGAKYHPYVRWWWNGNKVTRDEISRELKLLEEAGIGGVEINPIEFPHRIEGDDLGIPSLTWLSDEWIDMLAYTFSEAKKLGISCDLIVGSGWPFGSETLPMEERASVVLLNVDHIEGPAIYRKEKEEIYKAIDPKVTVPHPDRSFEILSLKLVTDPLESLDSVKDLEIEPENEIITADIPPGKHAVYTLVKVSSFASVINGAPGAAGPILNHFDKEAVKRYLNRMSSAIEEKTGPLSDHLRALFTDSMELEGCNWTDDLPEEFSKRKGYDLMPWLPFIMFKVGRLGAVVDSKYGVSKSADFKEITDRVRFDFEDTKAQLLYERFTLTYLEWCRDNGVLSRAQAYGRGFYPLKASLGYDIPEGESWTTNWLKHKVGEEMPDDDYRRGRAYTMINKYVSSAAHLSGKRVVSCEEMTNTYLVFNTSLERLKNGSDQSIISGITHSVWHGFNYSPPEAPYPGWIQYGSYINEQNNWWSCFKYLNTYKARISSLLQNADMYTDIAILPANADLWSTMGVQTDPFPEKLNVEYTSLLWEAICKNGGAADYISEYILQNATVKKGHLCYGEKTYSTIFLPGVSSLDIESAETLSKFVAGGGKLICIETIPYKAPGLNGFKERDARIKEIFENIKEGDKSFIYLDKPSSESYMHWYRRIMEEHSLPSYIDIQKPDTYLMQVRYRTPAGTDIFFFSNSSTANSYSGKVSFGNSITGDKNAWIWDPETGKRYAAAFDNLSYELKLGPAQSQILVFEKKAADEIMNFDNPPGKLLGELEGPWNLDFIHCQGESYSSLTINSLQDLSQLDGYKHFSGTILYKTTLSVSEQKPEYMELSGVHDIACLKINGQDCGCRWYGRRIFKVGEYLEKGHNNVEIKIITLMGNYMKSLEDNPVAQYWTNEKRKNQPLHPTGIDGKVLLYG